MALEIERKFLVANDSWRDRVERSVAMEQGYLGGDQCSIRVRVQGDSANLNIKSLSRGISRAEYEYAIGLEDAKEMLRNFATGRVAKTRHFIPSGSHLWEVDVFTGANEGLIVAEIELSHEEELFETPDWLGREVSDDSRYLNLALATHPFSEWK